jgi:hypothetical protein
VSPGDAFRGIRAKPTWVLALVVLLVFQIGLSVVALSRLDRTKMRERAEEVMRGRGMSQEQIDQALERQEQFMKNPVLRYGASVVSTGVITGAGLALLSLILLALVPMLGGASTNFMLNLAIATHAALVRILGAIVTATLMILRGPEHASTGLALLIPSLKSGFLHAFMSRIDIFSIWEVILLAMGVKIVYELKDYRSYVYLFILWLAYTAATSLVPGAGMRPG